MLDYRPTNPNRPPDWRWQFGKQLAEQQRELRKVRADRYVGLAARFASESVECRTEAEHLGLLDKNPELYEAWSLYNDAKIKSARWGVEARLLAAQSPEEIAELGNITPDTVRLYEKIFFNVSDKLNRPDYITHNVFTEAAHRGVESRAYDLLWKMFGYWAGPNVLNFLIFKFTKQQKPDSSPGSVLAYLSDDVRSQQVLKTALAMRTMPVNWQTQIEIVNLYYRMLEMERESEGGGTAAQESFQSSVKSFLSNVPWSSGLHQTGSNLVITQADSQAQALRAAELLTIGAGQVPPGLEALIASAKFPAPKQQPARLSGTTEGMEADTNVPST